MIKIVYFLGILFCGILLGGLGKSYIDTSTVGAQSEEKQSGFDSKMLIEGHGRAYTSWNPETVENFEFFYAGNVEKSFITVPKNKKLILTDVVYHPQRSVFQDITVNLAEKSYRGSSIMFQVRVSPGKSEVVNFCSGYTIESGKSVKATTDANAKDGQFISVSVSGYLVDE